MRTVLLTLIDRLVGLRTAIDVLCLMPNELARRLQIPDAQHITDKIAKALAPVPELIGGPNYVNSREKMSTGDPNLDVILGGGVLTGAIWEVVGERSALYRIEYSRLRLTTLHQARLVKLSWRCSWHSLQCCLLQPCSLNAQLVISAQGPLFQRNVSFKFSRIDRICLLAARTKECSNCSHIAILRRLKTL